ncbi:MAG: anthranilate synthase component I [Elusimicrobia bacterium RIFCSPHIGHO2_01_FULL_64_10]|nr:MAG: anthranilate synthase component I [Elusimicrobia bacterium RIFCSPHIGHO2_01_FULL_64_10]
MTPDLKTFKNQAKAFGLVPTFIEIPCDLDTPVTLYLKLSRGGSPSALLESAEGGEKVGRYSFISVSHHLSFECRNGEVTIARARSGPGGRKTFRTRDPVGELRGIFRELRPAVLPGLPRFCGGAVGFASYDLVRGFESLPARLPSDPATPDAFFHFTDECVILDHWMRRMILIKWNRIEGRSGDGLARLYSRAEAALAALARRIGSPERFETFSPLGAPAAKDPSARRRPRSNFSPKEFAGLVRKTQEYIRAGDVIQAVLSQRFEVETSVDPVRVYRALRLINPSPYLYLLKMGGRVIVGSSPEILVRKENRTATTRPIAGTRPRGATAAEDQALEKELLADPKERAEHLMLVDLGRNDLGRSCKAGTVRVPEFMKVERYSHVMHMVSTVEGVLKAGEDAFSLFRASFPAGTVTGAPKVRAMEIIEELERRRRGIYAGSVGHFSYAGDMDMAITIRTLDFSGGKAVIQAGAGIVADSIPEREEEETRSKAQAMLRALELAESGFA